MLAAESAGSADMFVTNAREYILNMIPDDRRFEPVLDEFNEYITFNGNDQNLTVEDHANYLQDLINTYVSD